jgi:hypothetical protein
MNPIHVPPNDGTSVNILGTPMLIRIHGRDTGGVLSVVETHDLPGGGPPFSLRTFLGFILRFLLSTSCGIRCGCKTCLAFPSWTNSPMPNSAING